MGGAADPLLALAEFAETGGVAGVLAVAIIGSDFRPSEYPRAKKRAQIATKPKNKTSNFPVPRVISVSSDEGIVELRARAISQNRVPHFSRNPGTIGNPCWHQRN